MRAELYVRRGDCEGAARALAAAADTLKWGGGHVDIADEDAAAREVVVESVGALEVTHA